MRGHWIKCSNGMMLNMDNVLTLKVHKNTSAIVAECVGNRTVDVESCLDRVEAARRIEEILGINTYVADVTVTQSQAEPEEAEEPEAEPVEKPKARKK